MKLVMHRLINYGGLEAFEMRPGTVTILRGGNGQGKTTVLNSFRSLAEGGKEPDSIFKDADEAIIKSVWEIAEGDSDIYAPGRYEITRTIKRDGYSLTVKGPDGKKIPKEKTFVDTFLPVDSFDPLAFDAMTDEERAEKLRKILLVPVDGAEIRKATSLVQHGIVIAEKYSDGVAAIEDVTTKLKASASELRKIVKDREGSIATFKASIDGRSAEDVASEWAAAEKERQDLQALADGLRKAIQAEHDKLASEAAKAFARQASDNADWHLAEQLKLSTALADRTSANEAKLAAAKQSAAAAAKEAFEEQVVPIEIEAGGAAERVRQLDTRRREADKLEGAKKQIQEWEAETIAKKDTMESIGVACDQLERLRLKKLASMQLEGMEIKGGKLYVDGILSSRVNTARRYQRWVQIASMNARDGQPIIVDNLEALEPENRTKFETALRESGLRLIGAMVDEGPLQIAETLATV